MEYQGRKRHVDGKVLNMINKRRDLGCDVNEKDKFKLLNDVVVDSSNGRILYAVDCCNYLNRLEKYNEKLKNENNMLRVTISRNEAYIERLKNVNPWSNTAQKK